MGTGWLIPVLELLNMDGGPATSTLSPGGTFRRLVWTWDRVWKRLLFGRTFSRPVPTLDRVWRWRQVSANSIEPVTLTKTVGDDRDFLFDLQRAPEIVAGATCSSATVSGGSGLTFGSPAVIATATDGIPANKGMSVRISGGSDNNTYEFALLVTTSTSRVLVVPARMVVVANDGS